MKNWVLEPGEAQKHHPKRREAVGVVWLPLQIPERRHGIVPAHDTGRKMVKTPPSSRDP